MEHAILVYSRSALLTAMAITAGLTLNTFAGDLEPTSTLGTNHTP